MLSWQVGEWIKLILDELFLYIFSPSFFRGAINSLCFATPFIAKPETNKPKGSFAAFGAASLYKAKHSEKAEAVIFKSEKKKPQFHLVCPGLCHTLFIKTQTSVEISREPGQGVDTCLHTLSHCLYFLRHWKFNKANKNSVYIRQFSRGKRTRWPDWKIKWKKNNIQKAPFPKEYTQKQSLTVVGWTKSHHLYFSAAWTFHSTWVLFMGDLGEQGWDHRVQRSKKPTVRAR